MKKLRVDVFFVKPAEGRLEYVEYGLVDYPPGAKPTTPTLFIGAYCKTKADKCWLARTVKTIVQRSGGKP